MEDIIEGMKADNETFPPISLSPEYEQWEKGTMGQDTSETHNNRLKR